MSEQDTVQSEPLSVNSDQESPPEVEGGGDDQGAAAAEKAICALKDKHAEEIAALTEQVAALRDAVKASLSAVGEAAGASAAPSRTAGVKDSRGGGKSVLAAAASQAHQTGSRADVQEYLRIRRKYV